jgi:hypothetical protein
VNSLKALDPEWPIREADIEGIEISQCTGPGSMPGAKTRMTHPRHWRHELAARSHLRRDDCSAAQ